jgi:hypothetical protein
MDKNNFLKFCLTDKWDNDFSIFGKPWSRGGFTFFCNRHILIRVPEIADVPENTFAPSTFKLWPQNQKNKVDLKEHKIPDFSAPGTIECEQCCGTGRMEFDNGVCSECNGDKYFEVTNPILIGQCHYSDRYLTMIKDLPELKFFPNENNNAAYFTFFGGDGLLMPMIVNKNPEE